jgi:hypothetical protein
VRGVNLAAVAVILVAAMVSPSAPADEGSPPTPAELARRLASRDPTGSPGAGASDADALAALSGPEVIAALDAFDDATPSGANWLRHGLERAVEKLGPSLEVSDLATYAADPRRTVRGRSLAFGWLAERDPATAERLLEGFLDDPALDLRREAVEQRLASAEGRDASEAVLIHRAALVAARDVDQVERIVAWLGEHGDPRDLAEVLGFVRRWQISPPFDNGGGVGFATVYPPEAGLPAPPDTADWQEVVTSDRHGAVDLNAALGARKGVLTYALAEVDMPAGGLAEVRLGSPCAVAVWVNGVPVMAHEVYHASQAIDQYVAPAEFRRGRNQVLVKCCQNEQTQPWAEVWTFQLRICDPLGAPLAVQVSKEAGR